MEREGRTEGVERSSSDGRLDRARQGVSNNKLTPSRVSSKDNGLERGLGEGVERLNKGVHHRIGGEPGRVLHR